MKPQVLKEYKGPGKSGEQDILFLLRPQANNCYFESMLLSVFRSSPEYRKTLWLEYMANMPGKYIHDQHIIEDHYQYRMEFATHGKKHMTETMKKKFQDVFGISAEKAEVYGAYAAMAHLHMDELTMFRLRVPPKDKTNICGQIITKVKTLDGKEIYIINHDIPALMTFNDATTNSAVIMFRTTLAYKEFNRLILNVLNRVSEALNNEDSHITKSCRSYLSSQDIEELKGTEFYRHKKLFHFSHGPFEQILDGRDFIYNADGSKVPIEQLTFSKYLMDYGMPLIEIEKLIKHPIVDIHLDVENATYEDSLFTYTRNMSYERGFEILQKIDSYKEILARNQV